MAPVSFKTPVRMNNDEKKTKILQSISMNTFSGFILRVIKRALAAKKDDVAIGSPIRNAINNPEIMIKLFWNNGL